MMLDIVNLKVMAAVMAWPSTHTSLVPDKLMCAYLSESQISTNAEIPENQGAIATR